MLPIPIEYNMDIWFCLYFFNFFILFFSVSSIFNANFVENTHNFYKNFFNHTARGEFYIFNTLVVDVRGLLKWKLRYWDFQSLWIFLYEAAAPCRIGEPVLEQHFCSIASLYWWPYRYIKMECICLNVFVFT